MPKIRYLKVRFANRIFAGEIPRFRAAVIEATKRQSALFHNHTADNGVIYRYPLIQYKVSARKASIICLEDGTDDIHYLFRQRSLDLRIGERRETFEIEDIHLQYYNLQLWDHSFNYALKNWQALNQANYRRYEALQTEVERLQFLEKLLTGNILSLASGIGWQVPGPITVGITKLKDERWLPFKQSKVRCFSLNFTCNVSLPDYVGLGKGVSVGFGRVKEFSINTQRSDKHIHTLVQ